MITLRNYQTEVVVDLLGTEDDVAVEEPTGSGKTVEMATAAGAALAMRGRVILIAAPQQHIEDAFTDRSYEEVRYNDQRVHLPGSMLRAARDSGLLTEAIHGYLREANPNHAMVCTHAAITRLKPPTDIPVKLNGAWLFLDEAHHAAASGLSQFTTAWRRAGGRLLFFTATAYRADGAKVVLPNMRVIRRTMSQHMAEGYAPGRIVTSINAIRGDEKVSLKQFYGDAPPPAVVGKKIATMMRTHWMEHGRPKTVIRVPVIRGGSSAYVSQLIKSFQGTGARVLDMTGQTQADKKRVLEALHAERQVGSHTESQYDVMVGIQRVAEGMDWPWCSDVYCVGMPRAIATLVQLLGRATRPKPEGYPEQHAQRSGLHIFVPCQKAKTLALYDHHSRNVLLLCGYMENSNSAHAWLRCRGKGHSSVLPMYDADRTKKPTVADEVYIDPLLRVEVEAAMEVARNWLHSHGCTATDVALVQAVQDLFPTVDIAVLKHLVVERCLRNTALCSAKVMRELTDALINTEHGNVTKVSITKAFDEVLAKFNLTVIRDSQESRKFARQILELTGRNIEDFALRLFSNRPFTLAWIKREISLFRAKNDSVPHSLSGQIGNWADSWYDVDVALRTGSRGIQEPLKGGLKAFCREHVVKQQAEEQLEQFAKDAAISPPELAILRYLQAQDLPPDGNYLRWGRFQQIAPGGRHLDKAFRLLMWLVSADDQPLAPLLGCYAINLWSNLHTWLRHRRADALLDLPPKEEKSALTSLIKERTLQVQVTEDTIVKCDTSHHPPIAVGQYLFAVMGNCHLSQTSKSNLFAGMSGPRISLLTANTNQRYDAQYWAPVLDVSFVKAGDKWISDPSKPIKEGVKTPTIDGDLALELVTGVGPYASQAISAKSWELAPVPTDWASLIAGWPTLREFEKRVLDGDKEAG